MTEISFLLAILAVLTPCDGQSAAAESDLRTTLSRPVAVRGSVLMLPVHQHGPGETWPSGVTVDLDDGTALRTWLVELTVAPSADPGWTGAVSNPDIRLLEGRDELQRGGAAYVLAELPEEADGPLWLGDQQLRPHWRETPQRPGDEGDALVMPWRSGPDRPDPDSPFHYWRWVLLAEQLELAPPDPMRFGLLGSLIARHYADLWLAGLERIEAESPGVALETKLWLTRRCRDGRDAFACWIADQNELQDLLGDMLNFTRSDETAMRRALDWCDTRRRLLFWTEAETGPDVQLAIVNRSVEPQVARANWRDSDEAALAVEVGPGELERLRIERPEPSEPEYAGLPAPAAPARQTLDVESPWQTTSINVGPARADVVPPGLTLAELRPTRNLAALDRGATHRVDAPHRTFVTFRRVGPRWEAFIEARRPPHAHADEPVDLDEAETLADLAGTETITLKIGSPAHEPPDMFNGASAGEGRASDDDSDEPIVLTVPERGRWRLWDGEETGDLEVHRRSYEDRWYCRVVLPERWVFGLDGALTTVAAIRSHADRRDLAAGPNPVVPWRIDPGRLHVDFTAWDAADR